MRPLRTLLPILAGLAFAAPAYASAGLYCEAKGDGPALSLVITRGLPGGIFGATLDHAQESRTTMGEDAPLVLVQSWIDERQILVDLGDKDVTEYVAKLRAKPIRDEGAVGTLEYKGRKYPVRCSGE